MKKHEPTFTVKFSRSKLQLRLMAVIHVLAILSCLINALPIGVNMVLILFCSGHFFYEYKQQYLHKKTRTLEYTDAFNWRLSIGDSQLEPIAVQGSTIVSKWLVVLHFKNEQGINHSEVIFKDTLTSQEYSLLAARLRITH